MKERLTTQEACEALSISRATLFKWAAAGKLSRVRITARVVRWRGEEIAQLLETGEAAA
ncbi:MAG: helix-turn-helix transcriptional regulator [Paracoccaceae bacterium]